MKKDGIEYSQAYKEFRLDLLNPAWMLYMVAKKDRKSFGFSWLYELEPDNNVIGSFKKKARRKLRKAFEKHDRTAILHRP